MQRAWRFMGIGLLGACALAGCGGDDGAETATSTSSTTTDGAAATTTSAPESGDAEVGGADDFTPGPISYRFVHVAPDFGDVDVYARTGQGVVEEYLLQEDVAFGDVLEQLRPPADGGLLVVPAGSTDLNRFTNDDVVADVSIVNVDDEGPHHTLVLHPQDDGDDGVSVTDHWEVPDPALVGTTANALPLAVPGRGLVVIANVGEESVYVARPGAGACLAPEPPGSVDTAVGGTVVQAFVVDPGATELALHSFDDQDFDCTEEPVLTATVDVAAGGRTFVLLHDDGSGNLAAMTFPLP